MNYVHYNIKNEEEMTMMELYLENEVTKYSY